MSSPSRRTTRVFVYGTLRRGEVNHHLLSAAQFVREARTTPDFTLFALDGHPGMGTGGTTSVIGELFDVDAATLAALDELEGYPGWYDRNIISLDGGDQALGYTLPATFTTGRAIIADGDWVRWARTRP